MSFGESSAEKAAQKEADEATAQMEDEEQAESDKNTQTMQDQLSALKRFGGGSAAGSGSQSYGGTKSSLGG